MATKDICTVEQIDNSTDITNIIIDESGNLRKVNLKKAVNNFTPPQEKIEQIQQNTNDIAWIRGDISDLKTQVSSLSEENTELKGDLDNLKKSIEYEETLGDTKILMSLFTMATGLDYTFTWIPKGTITVTGKSESQYKWLYADFNNLEVGKKYKFSCHFEKISGNLFCRLDVLDTNQNPMGISEIIYESGYIELYFTATGTSGIARIFLSNNININGVANITRLYLKEVLEENYVAKDTTARNEIERIKKDVDISNALLGINEDSIIISMDDADHQLTYYPYFDGINDPYWVTSNNKTTNIFSVSKGDTFYVKANNSSETLYGFIESLPNEDREKIQYAEGTGFSHIAIGEYDTITSPIDGYLYFVGITSSGNTNRFPTIIIKNINVAEKQEKPYVGAIYFDGWSNANLVPNVHICPPMLSEEWESRKPLWGWIAHKTNKCDDWIYSPYISIPDATNIELVISHYCALWTSESQCGIYIKEKDSVQWTKLDFMLPNAREIENQTTTVIDITPYANKDVQIGFRLKVSGRNVSPIWEISNMSIRADEITVFNRNFMNQSECDFDVTDENIWKSVYWGYNGNSYDTDDTHIIDHEINLASDAGIDYFAFDWYYRKGSDDFDKTWTRDEVRNNGIYSFMSSSQKYKMKFCLWIINESSYIIDTLQRWKDAIKFISDEYISDSQYLKVNGKPVVFIYSNAYFNEFKSDIDVYIKNELGYEDGFVWIIKEINTAYTWANSDDENEHPYSELVDIGITGNATLKGNIVPLIQQGWNNHPWNGKVFDDVNHTWSMRYNNKTYYTCNESDLPHFERYINSAMNLSKYSYCEFKSVIVYAWNEICEGGSLMPKVGDPNGIWLNKLKETLKKFK